MNELSTGSLQGLEPNVDFIGCIGTTQVMLEEETPLRWVN
jgi:hypothetical protein